MLEDMTNQRDEQADRPDQQPLQPEQPSQAAPQQPADATPAQPPQADQPDQPEQSPQPQPEQETAPASAAEGDKSAQAPALVEAVLFASDKPLPPSKINDIAQIGGVRAVRSAIEQLNARYDQTGAAFRVVHLAGGFQMQTLPEYAGVLARLVKSREESRLSQAAMETLAIVAYRQPVLRADIEAIRGVATGEVLHRLMEANLVKIVGRAEELGRPLLYGTTKHFLEIFGLGSLEDLPNLQQLKAPPTAKKPAEKPAQSAQVSEPAAAAQGEQAQAAPEQPAPESRTEQPPLTEQPSAQPDESAGTGEPAVPDAQADGAGETAPDLPPDQDEDADHTEC